MSLQKWEYMQYDKNNENGEDGFCSLDGFFRGSYNEPEYEYSSIKEAGEDGWELVSVTGNLGDEHIVLYFKRPIKKVREKPIKDIELLKFYEDVCPDCAKKYPLQYRGIYGKAAYRHIIPRNGPKKMVTYHNCKANHLRTEPTN